MQFSDIQEWHWLLLFIVMVLTLLYMFYPPFHFKTRIFLFQISIIVLSVVTMPMMLFHGRSVKNLEYLSQGMLYFAKIFKIRVKVNHEDRMIQDKPCVIVSNHQSSIDLIGMSRLFPPRSTFLAKKTLLYFGSVGLSLWLAGGVFVNRTNPKQSHKVMEKAAEELLQRKLKIWIFPEGTRGKNLDMLPFKKGAFNLAVNAQVPIVPVVFKSYRDFYDPKCNKFCSGTCVLEVLPAIDTKGLTSDDVTKLSIDCREIMIKAYKQLG